MADTVIDVVPPLQSIEAPCTDTTTSNAGSDTVPDVTLAHPFSSVTV